MGRPPKKQTDEPKTDHLKELEKRDKQFGNPLIRVDIMTGEVLARNEKYWANWRGGYFASKTQKVRSRSQQAAPVPSRGGGKRARAAGPSAAGRSAAV